MKNVVEATPTLIDTLKKAKRLVNSSNENINQSPNKNSGSNIELTSNDVRTIFTCQNYCTEMD